MVWTETTRPKYARGSVHYASDMTIEEWALIEPFMPPPKRTGRPRETELRDAFVPAPGLAWMAELKEDPNVDWNAVEPILPQVEPNP